MNTRTIRAHTRFRCEKCGYRDQRRMFQACAPLHESVQCPKPGCGGLGHPVARETSFRPRPAKKLAVKA